MLDKGEQGLRADKAWNLPFNIVATTSKLVWSGLISSAFVFFADEKEGAVERALLVGVDRFSGTFALPNFDVEFLLLGSEDGGPGRLFCMRGADGDRVLGSLDLSFFDVGLLLSVGSEDGRSGRVVRSLGED